MSRMAFLESRRSDPGRTKHGNLVCLPLIDKGVDFCEIELFELKVNQSDIEFEAFVKL